MVDVVHFMKYEEGFHRALSLWPTGSDINGRNSSRSLLTLPNRAGPDQLMGSTMSEPIDTYFDAWNETDDAARRTLVDRCLTSDVELIDENGRFIGHDDLGALMAKFHRNVPGGRIVRTSGFDQFEGITRYSWDAVDADGNTVGVGLDVVEQGSDGRLQRIVMFHGPLPALG
jgi:hypothetical protein